MRANFVDNNSNNNADAGEKSVCSADEEATRVSGVRHQAWETSSPALRRVPMKSSQGGPFLRLLSLARDSLDRQSKVGGLSYREVIGSKFRETFEMGEIF